MTSILIKFAAPGFHRWKDAPPSRSYLAEPHRHLFHVEVRIEVWHGDREIEFHDLLDEVKEASSFYDGEIINHNPDENCYMDWSCEHHAEMILQFLRVKYPHRDMDVSVLEDGECGATLTYRKNQ